jgi:hypothetical protein
MFTRIRKPTIYSPKQARKVIKSAKKGEIGFIICPSYTRKSKIIKELKGATIRSTFDEDQLNTKRNHANDPLEVPIGPITRVRTKKLKEALNEASTKNIEQNRPRGAWDI